MTNNEQNRNEWRRERAIVAKRRNAVIAAAGWVPATDAENIWIGSDGRREVDVTIASELGFVEPGDANTIHQWAAEDGE